MNVPAYIIALLLLAVDVNGVQDGRVRDTDEDHIVVHNPSDGIGLYRHAEPVPDVRVNDTSGPGRLSSVQTSCTAYYTRTTLTHLTEA